jgi:hypothetical protein
MYYQGLLQRALLDFKDGNLAWYDLQRDVRPLTRETKFNLAKGLAKAVPVFGSVLEGVVVSMKERTEEEHQANVSADGRTADTRQPDRHKKKTEDIF